MDNRLFVVMAALLTATSSVNVRNPSADLLLQTSYHASSKVGLEYIREVDHVYETPSLSPQLKEGFKVLRGVQQDAQRAETDNNNRHIVVSEPNIFSMLPGYRFRNSGL